MTDAEKAEASRELNDNFKKPTLNCPPIEAMKQLKSTNL